jgi:ATP-binding protein involved in chromosome partitioning
LVDPRIKLIDERLKDIKQIIAVSSGKGGVGKSLVASMFALNLLRKGYKVGLFDIDFTSPSTHVIFGLEDLQPEEKKGIIPTQVNGLKYMSIVHYSGEHPLPLRGEDVSNALIELFAVTKWDSLDFLIIDMPPGISDTLLDIIRFVNRIKFLLVSTSSKLAFETVNKLGKLFVELEVPVIGIIENMKIKSSSLIKQKVEEMNIQFLGEIPYDTKIEEAIGSINLLYKTDFSKKIEDTILKINISNFNIE